MCRNPAGKSWQAFCTHTCHNVLTIILMARQLQPLHLCKVYLEDGRMLS